MNCEFIKIGTCDFDSHILTSDDNTIGVIVEPLKKYLDNLPNKKNIIKINKAISNYNGKINIYHLPIEIIEKNKLPLWLKGCNSVNNYHPLVLKKIRRI
jgi:hypothetical protein